VANYTSAAKILSRFKNMLRKYGIIVEIKGEQAIANIPGGARYLFLNLLAERDVKYLL